jgi:hypothetical protein
MSDEKLKKQTLTDGQALDSLLAFPEVDIKSIASMSSEAVDTELVKLGIDPDEYLPERLCNLLTPQNQRKNQPAQSHEEGGWIDIIATNDNEALWSKLLGLIAKHSSTRLLYSHDELTGSRRYEIYSDLTQDLFLRLLEKDRWQYYLDNGYTSERIEQELNRIEVPNYISVLQRERYPEAYRLARRISELIKSRREFRLYSIPAYTDNVAANESARPSRKMVLQVYGLSRWPADKRTGYEGDLLERIKEVPCHSRDVRRMGRGGGSQVIISNEELMQLIVDIFVAIDTPLAIRHMRALVMSKLAIEDSRLVSLDAGMMSAGEDATELPHLDLPDERPTPLDALLAKETKQHLEQIVDMLLQKMRHAVRNKPQRFDRLITVVWSCYFDPTSPSHSEITRRMNISDSLVSHYRGIFDSLAQGLKLTVDEYILLNGILGTRLTALVSKMKSESGWRHPVATRESEMLSCKSIAKVNLTMDLPFTIPSINSNPQIIEKPDRSLLSAEQGPSAFSILAYSLNTPSRIFTVRSQSEILVISSKPGGITMYELALTG